MLGDRYRVERKLGAGAFGEVYEARDVTLDRRVAIKRIRLDAFAEGPELEEVKRRFVQEAQVAARLRHPNIVTIHDIATRGSSSFMVMELVAGKTLQALLRERGRLGLEETVSAPRASRGRPRLRPWQRHRSPRRETRQPHDRALRAPEGDGLRDRQGLRHFREHHAHGDDPGHSELHVPRTGSRGGGGRAGRPLLARLHALRVPERAASLHGRQRDRDPGEDPPGGAPGDRLGRLEAAASPGRRASSGPGEEPDRSLRVGPALDGGGSGRRGREGTAFVHPDPGLDPDLRPCRFGKRISSGLALVAGCGGHPVRPRRSPFRAGRSPWPRRQWSSSPGCSGAEALRYAVRAPAEAPSRFPPMSDAKSPGSCAGSSERGRGCT